MEKRSFYRDFAEYFNGTGKKLMHRNDMANIHVANLHGKFTVDNMDNSPETVG